MKNLNLFSLNNKKVIIENQYLLLLEKSNKKKTIFKVIIICEGKIVLFEKNKFFLNNNEIINFKKNIKKFIFLGKNNSTVYLGISLSYKKINLFSGLKHYNLFKILYSVIILQLCFKS